MLSLSNHEAHIWLVDPDEITDPAVIQAYFGLMNEEETAQQQRFLRPQDRHRYLVTRALVRTTLSRYMNREPHTWQFVKNAYHRPEIAPEQQQIPLRFNITHTNGLIGCLVNLVQDAGIDAEDITRTTGVMNIANFSFAPEETKTLLACPESERKRLFFIYWTLKEAYIKARGMGLALPLHQFSFHRSNEQNICIDFSDDFDDHAQHWEFFRYQPTDRHILSLAFCKQNGPGYRVQMIQCHPMVGEILCDIPIQAKTFG